MAQVARLGESGVCVVPVASVETADVRATAGHDRAADTSAHPVHPVATSPARSTHTHPAVDGPPPLILMVFPTVAPLALVGVPRASGGADDHARWLLGRRRVRYFDPFRLPVVVFGHRSPERSASSDGIASYDADGSDDAVSRLRRERREAFRVWHA